MQKINIEKEIEKLLNFGLQNSFFKKTDIIYFQNKLMNFFDLSSMLSIKIKETKEKTATDILDNMYQYLKDNSKILKNETKDMVTTKIINIILPMPSKILENFNKDTKKNGVEKALEKFYHFGMKSNYIKVDDIKKNEKWIADTNYGKILVTINLSKPEKDPKDIEAALKEEQTNYPKCLLCAENEGFSGNLNRPSRYNHRVLPLKIEEEDWFFQFSPYVYYKEHSIIINKKHIPMVINKDTFVKLFGVLKLFPHYIVGSNADLPIVGGSILSHEHFQAGNFEFPIEKAKLRNKFYFERYKKLEIYTLKWPLSVIRLVGNKIDIIETSEYILKKWQKYSDKKNNIISKTKSNHNTITPILRKLNFKKYSMDLVLRNNLTNKKYPDGIFHPYKELHHIKKENIGLIEVMGLAILPGRLKKEIEDIKKVLASKTKNKISKTSDIYKHREWINILEEKMKNAKNEVKNIDKFLKKQIGNRFTEVLECAGVFKQNKDGENGFKKFMNEIGMQKVRIKKNAKD